MSARPPVIEIPVALVRDYQQINREILRALDGGRPHVRLTDVEGQRLLVAGLKGPWQAIIEVVGNAGPELAADLDAPGLTVRCTGSAADGAARDLRAGRVVIEGDAGDATAVALHGGTVVVAGRSGHRTGLRQRGGTIILLGPVGRLLSDRQAGGVVFANRERVLDVDGRGRSGGRTSFLSYVDRQLSPIDPDDLPLYRESLTGLTDLRDGV